MYTYLHIAILLAQMLRNPGTLQRACRDLLPDHLDRGTEGVTNIQRALFALIQSYYTSYQQAPDYAYLTAQVYRFLGDSQEAEATRQELENLFGFFARVDDRSLPETQAMIKKLVDLNVHIPAADAVLGEVQYGVGENVDLASIASRLQAIQRARDAQEGVGIIEDVTRKQYQDGKRRRTGVTWLDSRCGPNGEGPVTGVMTVLLAGQGFGKTTSGIEFGIAGALQGDHTVLALAEMGMTQHVHRNILARATGIPTTLLSGIDTREESQIVKAAREFGADVESVMARYQNLGRYLHVLDLVEMDAGLEQVDQSIAEFAQKGWNPQLVYVDWAGVMANRILACGLYGQKYEDINEALKGLSYKVAELAKAHDTSMFISHQMTTVAAEQGVGYKATHYDAADCKMFTAPARYVLTIGSRCPQTRVQRLGIPKATFDKADQEALLRLNGPLARFEDVTDQFAIRGKRRVVPINARDNTHSVPAARG